MTSLKSLTITCFLAVAPQIAHLAHAETAHIAVAANFLNTMQRLKNTFEASGKHTLILSSGSTGQLLAQGLNGAPFDVLLAADQTRPAALANAGLAQPDSQVTYALGRLALVSRKPPKNNLSGTDILRRKLYRTLAIARPQIAPYGDAALQTLATLGTQNPNKKLVYAQSVAQAYTMAVSGAADLALVAASFQFHHHHSLPHPWMATLPHYLHSPIRQDAILTRRGNSNDAAIAFIAFLTSQQGRQIITSFGYDTP